MSKEREKVCLKCNGSGWYRYDHNHSKVCEYLCCFYAYQFKTESLDIR